MRGEVGIRILSWLYYPFMTVRNLCYDVGILPAVQFPVAIISVGNITTGGTGKTPFVEYLLRLFSRERTVAVVSRGFGRSTKGTRIVSDGASVFGDARSMGDEPYQIAKKFPQVRVVVDEDRVRGVRTVLANCRPDVVLLDDGYQHRRIGRSLDIVMIDGNRPLRAVTVPPRGFRREPLSGLRRAGLIAITRNASPERLEADLRRYTGAPMVRVLLEPVRLRGVFSDTTLPLREIKEKSCIVLSAVGNPASFRSAVRDAGAVIAEEFIFPDHQDYAAASVEQIGKTFSSRGCDYVITTEKDAVRLVAAGCSRLLPANACYYLEIEARVVKGESDLHAALERALMAAA